MSDYMESPGRRRVDFDPTEPLYAEDEPPEPYTGEPVPDYIENMLAYGRRQRVDADPTAAARRRDLPPPHMGALELPGAGPQVEPDPQPAAAGDFSAADIGAGAQQTARPSQLDSLRAEYDTLAADRHPHYRGSRTRAVLENLFYNLSRNAQAVSEGAARSGRPVDMYGLANVIGGGIGGGVAGGIRPDVIAERQREMKMRNVEDLIKEQLGIEKAHAEYSRTLAQAEYTRQRVPLDRLKREGMQLDRDKRALLSMWRTVGEYDPADHRFDSMTKEAQRLGVSLTPYKRGEKVPQRFQHMGRWWEWLEDDSTQEYYAAPVMGADGKPLPVDTSKVPNERGLLPGPAAADDDRDRAFGATQEYRRQLLSLSGERFQLALTNGLNAQAAREFGVRTAGLQQQVNQLRTQIEGWKAKAKAYTVDPADAERRIGELEAQAAPLLQQLEDARTDALGKMTAPSAGIAPRSTPTPATRPGAPSATAPAGRVSRKNFGRVRAQNPSLAGKSDAEVEAALRAQGIEVY